MTGLCVNVNNIDYIYTMGEEKGVCIELLNFPRFKIPQEEIFNKAVELGELLTIELCQGSYMIMTPTRTHYYSRHDEIRRKNRTKERLTS